MCRFHDSDGRRSDQPSSPAHTGGPLSVDAWHHDVPRERSEAAPIAQRAARWSATPSTDNAIRERGPDACRTTPVRTERQGSAQWHPRLAQEMEAPRLDAGQPPPHTAYSVRQAWIELCAVTHIWKVACCKALRVRAGLINARDGPCSQAWMNAEGVALRLRLGTERCWLHLPVARSSLTHQT